jgi:hypothetical protein
LGDPCHLAVYQQFQLIVPDSIPIPENSVHVVLKSNCRVTVEMKFVVPSPFIQIPLPQQKTVLELLVLTSCPSLIGEAARRPCDDEDEDY